MKLTLTFKTPDVLRNALEDVHFDIPEGLTEVEASVIAEMRADEVWNSLEDVWFKYGEYVSIEVDTEEMTATVLENV